MSAAKFFMGHVAKKELERTVSVPRRELMAGAKGTSPISTNIERHLAG